MAKLNIVYDLVAALNLALSSNDIRFDVSETRTSLNNLSTKGIIDYAKVDRQGRLLIALYKNLEDYKDWKDMLLKIPVQIESYLLDGGRNITYSFLKGDYLGDHSLTTFNKEGWGSTDNARMKSAMRLALDKIDTANVNALYDLKDDDDPSYARDAVRTANFIRYIKSGPTVVVPRTLWRSMGWSQTAIDNRIVVKYPESGSEILAILKKDFEKVLKESGFTVTEGEVQLLSQSRTPAKMESSSTRYRDFWSRINRIVSSENEHKSHLELIETSKSKSERDRREKAFSDWTLKKVKSLIEGPYKDEYAKMVADNQSSTSQKDWAVEWARQLVKDNMEVIDSKMVQIKKHPKQDYYVVRTVSGVRIPTY